MPDDAAEMSASSTSNTARPGTNSLTESGPGQQSRNPADAADSSPGTIGSPTTDGSVGTPDRVGRHSLNETRDVSAGTTTPQPPSSTGTGAAPSATGIAGGRVSAPADSAATAPSTTPPSHGDIPTQGPASGSASTDGTGHLPSSSAASTDDPAQRPPATGPAQAGTGTSTTGPAQAGSGTAGGYDQQAFPPGDYRNAYATGGSVAGSPYSSGVPQQAPGPDSQSPYATRTPAHPGAQYNSIPGDPSPGAGTPADAQTEMFRHDDPRLRAGQNQAPSGDYALPGQAPQSGYGSGEFAQPTPHQQAGSPDLPIQRPDGTWAQPAGGQSPQQAGSPEHPIQRPDGTWVQPVGGQSPQATELPMQRPDGTWAYADGRPAQPPNSAPQMQQLPDGTWVPVAGAAQWNQQPAQPQYQQPGHGQWGATPQQHGYQPPSLDNVPVKRAKKTPGSGWRKAVHHVSGGAINPGMSAEERRLQELVARIRQPVRGDYRIAVLSLKGGVGKTTTTMGLGSIFSSIRGDRVIAVDANPDFGTLSQRVPLQTRSTVRDLLLDPAIQRYSDVRRHTSQGSSRLEVLASERDPAASEAFNDEEYRAVARILQRFYNIILTDCGTGLMHSAMSGVLDLAHSLVLISSAAIDGARSAAATLDWLSLHGHDHLVRNAVVVINLPREGSPNVGVQQLREYFLSRCRAVHIIPYDEHLSEGAEIDLHRLHKSTKRAYVELAATVADEFGVDHRHFG